jgi:hypothetical protein
MTAAAIIVEASLRIYFSVGAPSRRAILTLPFASEERSMTPEDLNRTIEFIIQSQARLAAAQEKDHQVQMQLANLIQIQTELLATQSRRLDAFERQSLELMDDLRASRQESRIQMQTRHEETQALHEETLAWLRIVLEKITDRLN